MLRWDWGLGLEGAEGRVMGWRRVVREGTFSEEGWGGVFEAAVVAVVLFGMGMVAVTDAGLGPAARGSGRLKRSSLSSMGNEAARCGKWCLHLSARPVVEEENSHLPPLQGLAKA